MRIRITSKRGRWNRGVFWEKSALKSIFGIKNSVHKKQHTKITRTEESIKEKQIEASSFIVLSNKKKKP